MTVERITLPSVGDLAGAITAHDANPHAHGSDGSGLESVAGAQAKADNARDTAQTFAQAKADTAQANAIDQAAVNSEAADVQVLTTADQHIAAAVLAHNNDPNAHVPIIVGQGVPAGTIEADWTACTIYAGPNGKVWVRLP